MNILRPFLTIVGVIFAMSFPTVALTLAIAHHVPADALSLAVARLILSLVLSTAAVAFLIGGRYGSQPFILFLFLLTRAAQPASIYASLFPNIPHWLTLSIGAICAGASAASFVALCLRIPSGEAISRWRVVDRMLPFIGIITGVLYASSTYFAYALMLWVTYLVGFLAYLDRRRSAEGEALLRTRWLAVGIASHVGIEAVFLTLSSLHMQTPAAWIFMLNPAPFAFAYALLRGKIIDVRVVGGRAAVYGLLTSIPVCLVAFADWLFAKELEDVKLATVAEVLIAVAFSFWLQRIHRRIDGFVERVFFARRHRAFARLEQIAQVLPHVGREERIIAFLVEETAQLLELESAAFYRMNGNLASCALQSGANFTPVLDGDQPLILFARAQRRLVRVDDLVAVPLAAAQRIYGIAVYGPHVSGEAFSGEEERLLERLAAMASSAFEHLELLRLEGEVQALRNRLDEAIPQT